MPAGAKPGERRGGRKKGTPNKATAEIKALAQKHGPAAIKCLAAMLTDTNATHQAKAAACNSLLDRGYGKAPQALTGPEGGAMEVIVSTGIARPAD